MNNKKKYSTIDDVMLTRVDNNCEVSLEVGRTKEKRTFSELVEDITEILSEYEGEALADIYEKVSGKKCTYSEDSIFEVENKKDSDGLS